MTSEQDGDGTATRGPSSGSGVVAPFATDADLPELLADVLEVPAQMAGRQHESRDEQASFGVAGQRPAMNAELLSRLRSRQQSRISHVSTLGEISTSIIYL
jgi:hypothetical protein